jgi:ribosomal protein S12 methylthiotransferase accessory factor
MEAIELHAAEHIEGPLEAASAEELDRRGLRLVAPERLPVFQRVCDVTDRILWIKGVELGSGEGVFVPHELVHFDLRLPLPPGSGHFLISTSGLASGNDSLEAICHGLCELIERDATTLFYSLPWRAQWDRRLDLDSVDDPLCRRLIERYDDAGVTVAVWDTTSDVGAASFLCGVLDRETNPFRRIGLARGAGCHPDRRVALSRALCEAAQGRLSRIVGTRDDIRADTVDALQRDERLDLHRAQLASPERPPGVFETVPTRAHTSFDHDLAWLRERLAAVGIPQVVTVDLQPAATPFSVVRVIVPGLEAHSEIPGYRPGARALRAAGRGRT